MAQFRQLIIIFVLILLCLISPGLCTPQIFFNESVVSPNHISPAFLIIRRHSQKKNFTQFVIENGAPEKGVGAGNRFPGLEEQIATARPAVGTGGVDDFEVDGIAVSIRVKVSDVPQEFVSVMGKKDVLFDQFNNEITVVKFVGIPFAAPPVDNLRFQRPTLRVLRKDFEAMVEPPPCPQTTNGGDVFGEENCLYLNIYMPEESGNSSAESIANLPVLVWFHGESLEKATVYKQLGVLSSGSARELNADIFSKNKVIVVTPQYRLGTLGFLSTVNEDLNGNIALFDQLIALEWVNRFIKYFGGDPKQITIMGHGGSAMSLGLLATSELARGLFHRAILMSGSPLSPTALDTTPKVTFAEIAVQNSCPSFPTLRFVRCMQAKSFSQLVSSDFQLTKGKSFAAARSATPILQRDADGRFLPPIVSRNPGKAFRSGNFEQVPLLIGISSAELGGFLPYFSGKSAKQIPASVFGSYTHLKDFIRGVVRRASFSDPDMVTELATFEYFSGLDVTQRSEQAMDLLEEMLSDYMFNVPALTLARYWSKYAAVYFYVFDHVRKSSDGESDEGDNAKQIITGPNQAIHGSDINFLMTGEQGSAEDQQLFSSMIEFWVNFIYKGSPLNAGISWPQFREEDGGHIVFRSTLDTGKQYRSRQDYMWNNLIQDLGKRPCTSRRRPGGGGRNSVITFRDPEDFLKYTSALSPRSLRAFEDSVNYTVEEDSKESLWLTT